jgi:hypothetical protein
MSANPRDWIKSLTLPDVLTGVDPEHIHHDLYTSRLRKPFLHKAYGSTLMFGSHSSKFVKNGIIYVNKVLFKDFVVLSRDRDISIAEAVSYAIHDLDCKVTCSCPAFGFFGYKFMATQLGYQYGGPPENRFPDIRNPSLRGTVCKHCDNVLTFILENERYVTQEILRLYKGRGIPLTKQERERAAMQAEDDAAKASTAATEALAKESRREEPTLPSEDEFTDEEDESGRTRRDRGAQFEF